MRFDLKEPCKNCPFRTDATAIRFAARSRAEEIEESAYRHGFPCHLSATLEEDDGMSYESGYVFNDKTQHCAGALIMYLKRGSGNVPFEWLDEDEQDRVQQRVMALEAAAEGDHAVLSRLRTKVRRYNGYSR